MLNSLVNAIGSALGSHVAEFANEPLGLFFLGLAGVIVLMVLTALVKALSKRLEERWGAQLAGGPQLVYVLLGLTALVGAAVRSAWIALAAIVLAGVLAWWGRRSGLSHGFVAPLYVALVVGAFVADDMRARRQRDEQYIYFVLSFEDFNRSARNAQEIELSWRDYRDTLTAALRPYGKVNVMPATSQYHDYLVSEPLETFLNQRLRIGGAYPNVVLRTTAAMYEQEGRPLRLIVTLNRVVNDSLVEIANGRVRDQALADDKKVLSLRLATWVRDALERERPREFSTAQHTDSSRRLLQEYHRFLVSRALVPQALVAEVEAALKDPGAADVSALVNRYQSSSELDDAARLASERRDAAIATGLVQ